MEKDNTAMGLYQTEGVVLHKRPAGEYDKTVVLLTESDGLVHALVKGALRPGSKLGPLTEPLSWGLFELFRGKTQDRVTGCELRSSFPRISESYSRLVYAAYLCELEMLFSSQRDPDPEAFWFFVSTLKALETADDCWSPARRGEIGILEFAGLFPVFEECVACGKEVPGEAMFSPELGGILCPKCAGTLELSAGEIYPVSPGSRKTVLHLRNSALADVHRVNAQGSVRDEVGKLLRRYIAYVLGSRPKSAVLVEKLEERAGPRSRR
ncbi:MAG TPA: DNA repair protein RecO [Firmicutes bacterium]|nr:DNA repair protein RecO [Candidatus Fermentithermobacillaceae bacterium]